MVRSLLGILVSPRKYGNCELFVKELYRQLPGEWELKLVRLPELSIRPCVACYQCLFGEMECVIDDDYKMVLHELVACDAYVVAAPTYFLGANASLKLFLDRGLSFYGHLDELWGKPAAGVAIAGIEGMEGQTKLDVEQFIKLTLGDLRRCEVIYGALPGEIFLTETAKAVAQGMAQSLAAETGSPPLDDQVVRCPLCGGDTFRFLPGGRVRCMLCSSGGEYRCSQEGIEVHTEAGEHPLFLTYDAAKHHMEWLRGMKEAFLAKRKELKAVTQQYTRVGQWIRPAKGEES
ncbi:MAG: flavodoxin family protein [Syntrophobacteraceae bacterium]